MRSVWLRACTLVVIGLAGAPALADDKPHTAIVVGGGLAGLTAAYELQAKGWQVTVLEARDATGGRAGLANSEWVGNARAQPLLNQYLERFRIASVPAPEFVRTPGYLIDGVYLTAADLAVKEPVTAEALKRYETTLANLAASIEDPENPAASNTLFALDQINVSSWLDRQNLPQTARQLVNQQIRTRYDEPSRLSLLYFAQQTRVYRGIDERDRRAARLPGGSAVLAEAFTRQLKSIKTRSPVSAIVQDKDSVTVKAGSVGYSADYVVLAVPLRALGQIQLTPGLGDKYMAAIRGTNYGWRDQIMLRFKTPVWDSKARLSGEIYSNTGLGMLWIEPALKGGANVVVNLSGDNARVLQTFSDKQLADQVLIRLHTFYPQARGAYIGHEIRRYSVDPGTGGSYLAYGPGQISKFWRLWDKPVQRIAFAGEHTDTLYPGTLEGALRSGVRAAGQVADMAAGKAVEPLNILPLVPAAVLPGKADGQPGFFSRLFGGKPRPVEQQAPVAAPAVPPAPSAVESAPMPVPSVPVVPAKAEPAQPKAPVHKTPVHKAPAHKDSRHKPAARETVKKPVTKAADSKTPAEEPASGN